jgi:hypothetical protein
MLKNTWILSAVALVTAFVCGCGGPAANSGGKQSEKTLPVKKVDDHSGWWCDEHGIPEHECSMCSSKVFKKCEAAGDICAKHPDRAKSQCFICDPTLKEKFAVRYREKYGKEPPEADGQKELKK